MGTQALEPQHHRLPAPHLLSSVKWARSRRVLVGVNEADTQCLVQCSALSKCSTDSFPLKHFHSLVHLFVSVGSESRPGGSFAAVQGLYLWPQSTRVHCSAAGGSLVPLPGIEPVSPALQGNPSPRITREVPQSINTAAIVGLEQ